MFRPWFMLILARYGQGKFGVRIANFISLNPCQGWLVFDLIWNTLCSHTKVIRLISCVVHDDVWSLRVGGGVHDSYTFRCGLVGSFTSPGIDTS